MKPSTKQIPIGWIIVFIAVLIQLLVSFKVVQATFDTQRPSQTPSVFQPTPATSLIATTTSSAAPSSRPPISIPPRPIPFPWPGRLIDTDSDGIPNLKDNDIDNDGLANQTDPNVDGSVNSPLMLRLLAALERATASTKPASFARMLVPRVGDLLLNGDPRELDIDGDGFADAAVTELDIDGDFQRDTSLLETDIDGDGLPDVADDDIDGDALGNATDPDRDGDAVPNALDSDPDGLSGDPLPCKAPPLIPKRPTVPTSTTIFTPKPSK